MADTLLEPGHGGRWFQRGTDGSECTIGKVLEWDPPNRVVLSWQLTADWKYDPDFQTEVEVRFKEVEKDRTHVELVHRSLERYGEKAAAMRDGVFSEGGWPLTLRQYAEAVAG